MELSINYDEEYLQAQIAYIQGNYEEATTLVNRLVQDFPDDPSSRLLRGHIYCIQKQYDLAREQYQVVLNLTSEPELIDCANNGLESVNQYSNSEQSTSAAVYNPAQNLLTRTEPSTEISNTNPKTLINGWARRSKFIEPPNLDENFLIPVDTPSLSDYLGKAQQQDLENLGMLNDFNAKSLDFNPFDYHRETASGLEQPFGNFFGTPNDASAFGELDTMVDSFALNQPYNTEPQVTSKYKHLLNEILGYSVYAMPKAKFKEAPVNSNSMIEFQSKYTFKTPLNVISDSTVEEPDFLVFNAFNKELYSDAAREYGKKSFNSPLVFEDDNLLLPKNQEKKFSREYNEDTNTVCCDNNCFMESEPLPEGLLKLQK